MKATVIVLASWLEDLILRLISYIRVFTHARSSGQSHDSNSRSGGSENKKKCPFEVLGLEGGEDNTTMEEAIKARRKLALKRHPDRNPGNDEATKMMQEINDAFQKVERILTANREAKVGQFECTDDESDYEEMTGAQKRKYKQKQQKQQRDKEREFKRKAQEEFAKFTRAQKNAARGNYQSTTTYSSNESKSNNSRKKVTKSAKKKGRKGANRNDAQCQHFVNENKQAESKISSFDHFSPEKRCEMKFNSTDLPKMPIFNAIQAQAFIVVEISTAMENPCKHIDLPNEGHIFVTSLHLASYLGEYKAVEIIIRNLGEDWEQAVISTTRPGRDDCVALATEASYFCNSRFKESKANLVTPKNRKERIVLERRVEEYAERLAAAEKLVARLSGMKQLVHEKKMEEKKEHIASELAFAIQFWLAAIIVVVAVLWYHNESPFHLLFNSIRPTIRTSIIQTDPLLF